MKNKCQKKRCNKPKEIKSYCETHYFSRIAERRLGSSKHWKALVQLLKDQNYACALTGDKLDFIVGAELDHIIPIFLGGKKELSNVRWITKEANRLKGYKLDSELIALCKKICNHVKKQNKA